MATPDEVIGFWQAAGPDGWYSADPGFDAAIRDRFLPDWQAAHDGDRKDWLDTAEGALAYLILTDQFPRNMFRGTADAFATDPLALALARNAVAAGFDTAVDENRRSFFHMPFMHSENIADQERCVALFSGTDGEKHAVEHRDIVARFGRFPHRNGALGRQSTEEEKAFLDEHAGFGQ